MDAILKNQFLHVSFAVSGTWSGVKLSEAQNSIQFQNVFIYNMRISLWLQLYFEVISTLHTKGGQILIPKWPLHPFSEQDSCLRVCEWAISILTAELYRNGGAFRNVLRLTLYAIKHQVTCQTNEINYFWTDDVSRFPGRVGTCVTRPLYSQFLLSLTQMNESEIKNVFHFYVLWIEL